MANTVTTRDTRLPGLWVSEARSQTLLSGATPNNGGAESNWYAGELLLAALNTCATSLLHAAATRTSLELHSIKITSESERDPAIPDRYNRVHLHFELKGVTQSEADSLVDHFQRNCPIYGTVSRGAPTTVSVAVVQRPSRD